VWLLRVFAANPAIGDVTIEAVCTYFVAFCRSKLSSRTNKFSNFYAFDNLEAWNPKQENVSECTVAIHSEIPVKTLKSVGLQPHSGSLFLFTTLTMILWWKALLRLLRRLTNAVHNKPAAYVTIASLAFHSFISRIPDDF
jgi:hypothetical protein